MKTAIVSISDTEGGAARAAYRLHHALMAVGVDSSMLVLRKRSNEGGIDSPFSNIDLQCFRGKRAIATRILKCFKATDPGLRSLGLFPSPVVEMVNRSDCDVVNIHWACDEYLSIRDISRIDRPVVITMHDMWYFTGTSHYVAGDYWMQPGNEAQVHNGTSGPFIDRWMMKRKRKHLRECDSFVSPSLWLTTCAKRSVVLGDSRHLTIPNALDLNRWIPKPVPEARECLSIPSDKRVVLFGAIGGGSDPRKGADLMLEAIAGLDRRRYHVVVFGQSGPDDSLPGTLVDQWLGPLSSDAALVSAYSAADVFVMSSRMENFPNTCVEAQACGTPVAGFLVGGVAEIVADGVTGKLARPFDSKELTEAIEWCALNADSIREVVRSRITGVVDQRAVGLMYRQAFQEAIARWKQKL